MCHHSRLYWDLRQDTLPAHLSTSWRYLDSRRELHAIIRAAAGIGGHAPALCQQCTAFQLKSHGLLCRHWMHASAEYLRREPMHGCSGGSQPGAVKCEQHHGGALPVDHPARLCCGLLHAHHRPRAAPLCQVSTHTLACSLAISQALLQNGHPRSLWQLLDLSAVHMSIMHLEQFWSWHLECWTRSFRRHLRHPVSLCSHLCRQQA